MHLSGVTHAMLHGLNFILCYKRRLKSNKTVAGLAERPGGRAPLILEKNRRKLKKSRQGKQKQPRLKKSQKEENPEGQAKQNRGRLISTPGSATI